LAVRTVRHPNMMLRWAKRGFAAWSTWRLVQTTLKQQRLR